MTGFNLQRSDYTFDRLLAGDEAGRDLFEKEPHMPPPQPAQQSLFADWQEAEAPADEGKFVGKTISHYRRVQENG